VASEFDRAPVVRIKSASFVMPEFWTKSFIVLRKEATRIEKDSPLLNDHCEMRYFLFWSPRSPWPGGTLVFAVCFRSCASDLPTSETSPNWPSSSLRTNRLSLPVSINSRWLFVFLSAIPTSWKCKFPVQRQDLSCLDLDHIRLFRRHV